MATTVVLLVGLPGSGKSSLARQLCETRNASAHIEYDRVAASLCEEDELEAWRKSRSVAVQELTKRLQEFPSLIVMDDNFHLRSMRKTIYRVCQDHVLQGKTIYFGVAFIDTPVEMCLERNSNRATKSLVADGIIEKMNTTLEPPDPAKATWDSSFVRVSGGDINDLKIVNDWLGALCNSTAPLQPPTVVAEVDAEELERERQATRESRVQQYDQLLRKWVGEVAKINKRSTGTANSVRKKLLQELRSRDSLSEDDVCIVDKFCEEVCVGWNEEQIYTLRATLMGSFD